MKEYKSVKEFVNDLIDHEGFVFADNYGRLWAYKNYKFLFKDLGDTDFKDGLFCVHLFSVIFITNEMVKGRR